MIAYLYVLKDSMTGAWSKITSDTMAPKDVLEGYRRHIIKALRSNDKEMQVSAGMLKGNILYHIGTFDDVTGILTAYDQESRVLVGDLTDFFNLYANPGANPKGQN